MEKQLNRKVSVSMRKGLLIFMLSGALSAVMAVAQQNPAPGGAAGAGAGAGGGGGRGGFGGMRGGGIGLDDQQRQLYREALQKDSEKLRALDEKLRAAQKDLVDATLAATYDEKTVKEKAEAVANIQVEITLLRSKALATVAPTLKPEQKQQLSESRFAIMMLSGGGMGGGFDPTAMGGGFGGRGGGPGAAGGGPGGGGRGGRGGRGGGGGGGGTGGTGGGGVNR